MRYKLTVLLLILNIAVFSLIFYVDRAQSTENVFEASSRSILEPSFVQGLQEIRITSNRTGSAWILRRKQNESWDVTAPLNWKANPFAIQQLLFQLKALSWESRFPVDNLDQAGQSLESYDLEEPPLVMELSNGSSLETLAFGAPTEIGNRLYTMSPDGDYIWVINRNLMDTLQRELDGFLDKRVLGLGTAESRVIQIQDRAAGSVRVRMERDASGWQFVSPIEADADNDRVQALLTEWQELEGDDFRPMETSDLGLDGGDLRLTLEGLNNRAVLSFSSDPVQGESGQQYLAKLEGYETVFKISAARVDELRRVQEELRERRILHRHADDWTSLAIYFGDLSTTLQQLESGSWQVLSTGLNGQLISYPADPGELERIRELMRSLEVVRFVSDAPSESDLSRFGLDDPQRRIVLKKPDGQLVELQIGGISSGDSGTLLYGKTNTMSSAFLLRPHILAGLPLNPVQYRERIFHSLPNTASVLAIRLEKRESGEIIPIDSTESPEAWIRLHGYLKSSDVEGYLEKVFADPLQLDQDRSIEWPFAIHAEVSYGDASSLLKFFISQRLGGTTQYIGNPDTGLIGILPPDIIELLDSMLVEFPEEPELVPDNVNGETQDQGSES